MDNLQTENTLTHLVSISYLLHKENETMNGSIRAKGKCPVCQGKFTEIKKGGVYLSRASDHTEAVLY